VFCKGGLNSNATIPSYALLVTGSTGVGQFLIGNNTAGGTSNYVFNYPSSTFATNSWIYFAAVRSSTGVITTYVNGTLQSTSGSGINVVTCVTETFAIGAAANTLGSSPFSGYIQDFRITKGFARTITASPTSAFPTK